MLGIHREEGDRKSKAGGTLLVLQTNNIERLFEELKQKGVKFLKPQIEKAVFGAVADFKDPDEYLLEIWQPQQDNVSMPFSIRENPDLSWKPIRGLESYFAVSRTFTLLQMR